MSIPQLDPQQTAQRLPFSPLLAALRTAVTEYAGGEIHCPERLVVPLPASGVMLSMPAVAADLSAHKLVNVCPGNSPLGLPTIQGMVTAYDSVTGTPLFTLDAPTVTARRTATISLLGIEVLHGPPRHVTIIGTGGQALGHVQAVHAIYPQAIISVVGRTPEKSEAASEQWDTRSSRGVPEDADVVITTTTSQTPVYAKPARPGRLVVGVGAFTPDAAEISPRTIEGSQLFVDDPAGAQHEAGDFLQADVDWATVRSLADALNTPVSRERPSLFKSVGCAAWDLAACRVARSFLS